MDGCLCKAERALAGRGIRVDSRGRRETVTQGLCSETGLTKAMQPTADQRATLVHFMRTHPLQIMLALASGGSAPSR